MKTSEIVLLKGYLQVINVIFIGMKTPIEMIFRWALVRMLFFLNHSASLLV